MLSAALLALALPWPGWSAEGLERARASDRPIAVAIGGAPCEECVEARDLGDPAVASLIGERFVALRVDRDLRPDLAALYGSMLLLVSEADPPQAGDPFLIVLTREGRPVWGAALRGDTGAAALAGALERVADAYRDDRSGSDAKAGAALAGLRDAQRGEAPKGPLGPDVPRRAVAGLKESFDAGRAPLPVLRLLFEEHARTGDAEALRLAGRILDARDPHAARPLWEDAQLLQGHARADALGAGVGHRAAADTIAARIRAGQEASGLFRSADGRAIAGWNGLALGGLALSGRKGDLDAARRGAVAVLGRLGPARSLARCDGDEPLSALLEDHALLAEGLLELAEASGERRWRDEAVSLVDAAIGRFLDVERGGFFATDARHGPLPVRLEDAYDTELPAANGVMASVLLRLARVTGEKRYAELGGRVVTAFLGDLQRAPRGLATLAAAAGELVAEPLPQPTAEPKRAAREVRGHVTLEMSLSTPTARPGELVEARLELLIAKGWCVAARRPLARELVGLSVAVLADDLSAAAPRYPEGTAIEGVSTAPVTSVYLDAATVVVPVRVPKDAAPGPLPIRLSARYQPCDGREFKAPERAILEVGLEVVR